ncbi:MAG: hypothetical protein ACXWMO_09870 [Syntrophales bacterium]
MKIKRGLNRILVGLFFIDILTITAKKRRTGNLTSTESKKGDTHVVTTTDAPLI